MQAIRPASKMGATCRLATAGVRDCGQVRSVRWWASSDIHCNALYLRSSWVQHYCVSGQFSLAAPVDGHTTASGRHRGPRGNRSRTALEMPHASSTERPDLTFSDFAVLLKRMNHDLCRHVRRRLLLGARLRKPGRCPASGNHLSDCLAGGARRDGRLQRRLSVQFGRLKAALVAMRDYHTQSSGDPRAVRHRSDPPRTV